MIVNALFLTLVLNYYIINIMLTVTYLDLDAVSVIYKALGVEGEPLGANFVMYDGSAPVALWRMNVLFEEKPIGNIDKIVFADGVVEEDKLFFVHAMFFKLIDGAPLTLRVNGVHDSLKRFGFEEVGGNMEVFSKNIDLHYMCSSKKY